MESKHKLSINQWALAHVTSRNALLRSQFGQSQGELLVCHHFTSTYYILAHTGAILV